MAGIFDLLPPDPRSALASQLLQSSQAPARSLGEGIVLGLAGLQSSRLQEQIGKDREADVRRMAEILTGVQQPGTQDTGTETIGLGGGEQPLLGPRPTIDAVVSQLLTSGNPRLESVGNQLAMQQLMTQQETPGLINVAPEHTLFDPVTRQEVFRGPRKRKLLDAEELAQAKEIEAAGRDVTNLSVGGPRIQAFEGESGKLAARQNDAVETEIRGNARAAARTRSQIRRLRTALEGASQGTFRQFLPELAKFIPGLDASNEQIAAAQINDFVLGKMSAFKGATSERELDFARQTIASLGNTPEANRQILNNLDNAAFLSEEENRQLARFVKDGGAPRDFVFNFDRVVLPGHPKFGNVTISDVETTARVNGISMAEALQMMKTK